MTISRAAAATASPIESDKGRVIQLHLSGRFRTLPHTKTDTTPCFVSSAGWKSVARQAKGSFRSVTKTHVTRTHVTRTHVTRTHVT